MSSLIRRDEEVTDPQGNPVSGVQIALATQPANTSSFPPTPAVQLYSDPAGKYPITQPVQTDQDGHASYYALLVLTCVYYSTQIATPTQTIVMPDQAIVPPSTEPQYNSDTSVNGSILPSPNGTVTGFTLSGTPVSGSLILMLNGLVVLGYGMSVDSFGHTIVIFETAPLSTDVITATYQIQ